MSSCINLPVSSNESSDDDKKKGKIVDPHEDEDVEYEGKEEKSAATTSATTTERGTEEVKRIVVAGDALAWLRTVTDPLPESSKMVEDLPSPSRRFLHELRVETCSSSSCSNNKIEATTSTSSSLSSGDPHYHRSAPPPPLPEGTCIVTSIPDFSEFSSFVSFSLEDWKTWFMDTVTLTLSRLPRDKGVAVFYQTDIRYNVPPSSSDGKKLKKVKKDKEDGEEEKEEENSLQNGSSTEWIDKGFLVQLAAERLGGFTLLWHKIVCRAPPGKASFKSPGYTHLLSFARQGSSIPALLSFVPRSTADVIASAGEKSWTRGMGADVGLMLANFFKRQCSCHTVVQPFCGEGVMLATANLYGMHAIGVEASPKRAAKARFLVVGRDGSIIPYPSSKKPSSVVTNTPSTGD